MPTSPNKQWSTEVEKGEGLSSQDGSYGLEIVPLQRGDLWKVSQSWIRAFKDDPFLEYLRADAPRPPEWRERTAYTTAFALWLNTDKVMLTIDGVALLLVNKPGRRSQIDVGFDNLGGFALAFNDGVKTKEQLKRMREAQAKIAPAMDSAIPPSEREKMYYIDGIGTDPAYQGHGFGSMLLQAITERADEESRSCWLASSNVANDGFYNSHGFFAAVSFFVGDENPECSKKPVLLQIMVRKPAMKADQTPSRVDCNGALKARIAFSTPFRLRLQR
ncbi:hypothetical protein D9619_004498 [Psilocybe cf. subviscida]|uniref:N-acetyltransferase domain-containing protein n=1 Tax=Psilocybe cf. subviscida TaxID=2480587 RepID=A0A8H5F836_9AGAR|nr:hypothetical protein D9619_004498 [Psilocybe cf. subviscida]